jgi:hypothetical protein
LLSAAFVAVIVQVSAESSAVTVVPDTEQPPVPPAANVKAPVPLPPLAVAVAVAPEVMVVGPVTVRAACVALVSVTAKAALAADTV